MMTGLLQGGMLLQIWYLFQVKEKELKSHLIRSGQVRSGQVRSGQSVSSVRDREGMKEMFYLTMHSTHFIYGYMAICDLK